MHETSYHSPVPPPVRKSMQLVSISTGNSVQGQGGHFWRLIKSFGKMVKMVKLESVLYHMIVVS